MKEFVSWFRIEILRHSNIHVFSWLEVIVYEWNNTIFVYTIYFAVIKFILKVSEIYLVYIKLVLIFFNLVNFIYQNPAPFFVKFWSLWIYIFLKVFHKLQKMKSLCKLTVVLLIGLTLLLLNVLITLSRIYICTYICTYMHIYIHKHKHIQMDICAEREKEMDSDK